mmetsp:Transcript_9614/g.22660  ORF Transcript_9614/g.22660 Transcript_9614/m.22660 type:complete len:225 (-) Transcript_9614:33-707(-)
MLLEVSVALLAVLCLRLLVRRVQGPPAPPSFPQVPGWPLIGSLIELRDISRMTEKVTAWAKVYGEEEGAFEFTLAGQRFIVVCKHALATELLAQRPFKLRRGAATRESVPFEGLFMAEGDQWRQDKRVVGPAFSHKHLKEYLGSIKLVAERLVDVLAVPAGEEARTVEARGVTSAVAADIIAFTAFGHDFDSLRQRDCPVLDALKQLFPIIMLRVMSPVAYWKL